MIKWIKQRNQHSCVPIAILNLLKWCGHSVSYRKDFGVWSEQVNHTKDGTHIRDYAAILNQIPEIRVKRVTRPTIAEIDRVLSTGSVVLLRCAWKMPEIHRHLLLIVGRKKNKWFLTNTFRGHSWFSIDAVEEFYLEQHRLQSGIYPTAWFIRKWT